MSVKAVLDYFHKGHQLEQGHLVELLQAEDPECQELLRKEADQVRREHVGDIVYFRGIIEFSNYCPRSCQYCGISRLNRKVKRYRIPPQVILDTAFWGARAGCGTMVLQSGEDHYYSVGLIADIIREIKKMGVAVTLSLGKGRSPITVPGAKPELIVIFSSWKPLIRICMPGCTPGVLWLIVCRLSIFLRLWAIRLVRVLFGDFPDRAWR